MDFTNLIEIPKEIPSSKLLEEAFLISVGARFSPEPLGPGEAQAMIEGTKKLGIEFKVGTMKGRKVDLVVYLDSFGKRFVRRTWPSHSPQQLMQLLNSLGIKYLGELS